MVTCDYCGAAINTEKDKKCPNCGAPLKFNKDITKKQKEKDAINKLSIEHRQAMLEGQRLDNQRKRMDMEQQQNIHKIQKTAQKITNGVKIFFIVLFVVGFCAMCARPAIETLYDTIDKPSITEPQETEPIMEKTSVNFGEKANTARYSVVCDEIKEINPYPWNPDKGYRYVAIHFIVTNNLEESQKIYQRVNCIVNGIAQDGKYMSGYKDISNSYVSSGLSVDGYEIFQIPIDVQTIEIRYGDYIIINVAPENILQKN